MNNVSTPTSGARPGYGTGRDALVSATITIVATQGIRKLTYRAVAAAAGVTHGTVQHHFANLDTLLEAALEHCVDVSIADSALSGGHDSVDNFMAGLSRLVSDTLDEQVFQYELVLESRRRPELRPHVERYYARYAESIGESLRRMHLPDDDTTVEVVFSAVDGLVFRALTLGDGDLSHLDVHLGRLRELLHALGERAQET
ncbi:TetR/AcrR family transcriptional regulator [Gordonia sp. NPDC003504]